MRFGSREAALLAVAVIAVGAVVVLLLRPPGGVSVATSGPTAGNTAAPSPSPGPASPAASAAPSPLPTARPTPTAEPTPKPTPKPTRTPRPTRAPTVPPTPAPTPRPPTVTLVGAGDIADCGSDLDAQTAALVADIAGTVFTLGDNAYEDGKPSEFRDCYDPTWGQFRSRTRPAPGNHDYRTDGAAGYFAYFGDRAGPAGRGYYAYTRGAWRIYSLNSQCGEIGGCGAGSAQLRWLQADLAAHPSRCALAYWHHPRYSSGEHGNNASMDDIWDTLFDAGVEIVMAGHDHSYERFAPMNKAGNLAPEKGITSFVVGTGGRHFYDFGALLPTSRAHASNVAGVLRLTLKPASWEARFIPVAGDTYSDHAQDVCH